MISKIAKGFFFCLDRLVAFLSGEWMLKIRSNGGTIVFLRALWVTALVMAATGLLNDDVVTKSSCRELATPALNPLLGFSGAVFVFAYTAFYARFASQWSYLANVYNQIMAAKLSGSRSLSMSRWQAGFIEDADELHLAEKPMFAGVILSMLKIPQVRHEFITGTAGGEIRLHKIEKAVRGAYDAADLRYRKRRACS